MVAAQVDVKLKQELDIDLIESVFWTDSTTVLKYLNNKRARYQTFVANRVNLIRELTDVSAWRYVDTANNPADITSRGLDVEDLIKSEVWTTGPSFLRLAVEFCLSRRRTSDVVISTRKTLRSRQMHLSLK